MRVAIIGAGVSGLATCYYLLTLGCLVDLFDEKGVGGAASGIASGLLHPYPGEEGKRSWRADDALQAARDLFASVGEEPNMGIARIPLTEEERLTLQRASLRYGDLVESGEAFLITSGMTVNVPRYLQQLWEACQTKGARLHLQKVGELEELEEYDQIVVAAGAGSPSFSECKKLNTQKTKGQLLLCNYPKGMAPLDRSLIGKGYIALGADFERCLVGSTYERNFATELPEIEKAKAAILPKIATFFPKIHELVIEGCHAAVRLSRKGHYLPYVRKIGKKSWACLAMGSRGLLYHAFAGKMLAHAIVAQDESRILPELS